MKDFHFLSGHLTSVPLILTDFSPRVKVVTALRAPSIAYL